MYQMCLGITLSKFLPFIAVITAQIPSPSLINQYFLVSMGSMLPRYCLQIFHHGLGQVQQCTECLLGIFVSTLEQKLNIIILLMENLPPINEMYSCIQQQRDYDVIRKYEHPPIQKNQGQLKKHITKKGSYLDDAIKMSTSPGPANNSNVQENWGKTKTDKLVKYSDRKTYVDQIQRDEKKKNSPSPNHYNLKLAWPDKASKSCISSQKINFLDHSQYESIRTPGPGNYLIATNIAKRVKQYHYIQNKPLQPRKQVAADMNTYDPVPQEYATFKWYQKLGKNKPASIKKQQKQIKKPRQNLSPGPGQYQMIHTWQGKQKKMPEGSLTYLNKIAKGPTPNVYYR